MSDMLANGHGQQHVGLPVCAEANDERECNTRAGAGRRTFGHVFKPLARRAQGCGLPEWNELAWEWVILN